jgi:uncharacterized protein involved in tolerance to divalent cations
MTDKRIVLSTAGSVEEARKIARHLVENQLAACVNIVPEIESIYRWQGKVESSSEWLLLIKTTSGMHRDRDRGRQLGISGLDWRLPRVRRHAARPRKFTRQ